LNTSYCGAYNGANFDADYFSKLLLIGLSTCFIYFILLLGVEILD